MKTIKPILIVNSFVVICILISILILTGCSNSQEKHSTILMVANVDSVFHYHNCKAGDIYITKITFEGKTYTILGESMSFTDFKIINKDTINIINPKFTKE